MSTLADSFLADLEELEDDENVENEDINKSDLAKEFEDDVDMDGMEDEEDAPDMNTIVGDIHSGTVNTVKHLVDDPNFKRHIELIQQYMNEDSMNPQGVTTKGLENKIESNVIIESNEILLNISEEISNIQKKVSSLYDTKFPELPSILTNAMDYIRVVERVGNEMDITLFDFSDILPSNLSMVVTISGSTTHGKPLSPEDLHTVQQYCQEALQLDEKRTWILQFIESRMVQLAPNLSSLLGTHISALLLGQAGGLKSLASMPSCNVMVIGQNKQDQDYSFSSVQHAGIVYQSDLIQECPPDLRTKACRVLANKLVLAARKDLVGSEDGSLGEEYRRVIQSKIELWQKPTQGPTIKPMAAPGSKPHKKRGGRRVRRIKERLGQTEMHKLQNRMTFGISSGDYADDAMMDDDFGMIGQEGSGVLKTTVHKQSMARYAAKRLSKVNMGAGTSGTASSFVFNQGQGLEIVNPRKQAKKGDDKYFSSSSGFASVRPN
ncbi:hypothetical protein WA158_001585 [Blastocystis sp. Blastoise]